MKIKRASNTAQRLKELMEKEGVKQVDLVRMTGLNKSSVSRYLAGEVEPKSDAISKLAQALGVSEMWLWGYDVPRERSVEQKKNDRMAVLIMHLRRDADFFDTVCRLEDLSADQYASIKQLLGAFGDRD